MKYITNDGKLLQGSTYHEILEAYQATSKFDAGTPFDEYLRIMWRRLKEWTPIASYKKQPIGEELITEVFGGLVLNGFLTEVK